MKLQGSTFKFGNDIDTDAIIPARHINTSDPAELALHVMEDADPDFMNKFKPGDVIVAGKNFGCGSSREHAPIAIKAAGLSAVIAESFARIFYRNAFNMGLPIFESAEAAEGIDSGDQVEIEVETGKIWNKTKDVLYQAQATPDFMQELIKAGGLVPYVRKKMEKQ